MQSLDKTISSHANNYNLIRLVLASSVIFFHSFVLAGNTSGYTNYLNAFLANHGDDLGGLAVGCFFFLSGVFVTQSFHRDGSPLNFFIRRFFRLWPGLFFCLVITAILACVACQGTKSIYYVFTPDFYHYIVSNSLFSLVWYINGVFEGRQNSAINGSIHTLPTEVKMYFLLLGLGCLVSLKKTLNIVAGAVIFLLAIIFFDKQLSYIIDTPYNQQLAILFYIGVIAFAYARHIKPYYWFGAVSLILDLIMPAPWNVVFIFTTVIWIIIYVGQSRYCWSPKYDLSYGIYIYGWPSQQFTTTFFPHINPYSHAATSLLMAAGFAAISWRLVEKPAMAFGRDLIAAWKQFRIPEAKSDGIQGILRGWPRFAAMACVFLACVALQWVVGRFDFTPPQPLNVNITSIGPTGTKKGQDFNVLPNGSSAIWLILDQQSPKEAKIVFDGEILDTIVGQHMASAVVPRNLYTTSGSKTVFLEVRAPGIIKRSPPVTFRVE